MTFIVILAILTGMFIGFRRGFLRSVFKLLTAILSIVLSYVLAPVIANWVITYTDWDDSLQTSIATQITTALNELHCCSYIYKPYKPDDVYSAFNFCIECDCQYAFVIIRGKNRFRGCLFCVFYYDERS